MKVKISYSVDIDAIPQKVAEIVQSCEEDVLLLAPDYEGVLKMLQGQHNSVAKLAYCLESLESLRRKLAEIDNALLGGSGILESYAEHLQNQQMSEIKKEEAVKPSTVVPAPPPTNVLHTPPQSKEADDKAMAEYLKAMAEVQRNTDVD